MDPALSPLLETDRARVVRLRLKAEEYRAVAEQTRNQISREIFLQLAVSAERMAAEAQTRIDAHAALAPSTPAGEGPQGQKRPGGAIHSGVKIMRSPPTRRPRSLKGVMDAMATGISDRLWSMEMLLIDGRATKPNGPQTYRKRDLT